MCLRMVFFASHGSTISMNAQRPKPPWLLIAGTQRFRAVATFTALSFLASPLTSSTRCSGSSAPVTVFDIDQVIRHVRLLQPIQRIGDREAQLEVLDVPEHFRHILQRLRQSWLPNCCPAPHAKRGTSPGWCGRRRGRYRSPRTASSQPPHTSAGSAAAPSLPTWRSRWTGRSSPRPRAPVP